MISSLRTTIRALVAPEHRLSCRGRVWRSGLAELRRRGKGHRESGAFLLGRRAGGRGAIERFAYFDDLDPRCLDSGIVVFDGAGFPALWRLCREAGLEVVADVHTHPGAPRQSATDRANPMIAHAGHVALIVPNFARRAHRPEALGIYEYAGEHRWHDRGGRAAGRYFYIGIWG